MILSGRFLLVRCLGPVALASSRKVRGCVTYVGRPGVPFFRCVVGEEGAIGFAAIASGEVS